MTPKQIRRNPFAREAALLGRIERQEKLEATAFRVMLVVLALFGAWLIWLRNSYAGAIAIPTDAVLVLIYWVFIAVQWRNDARD